MMSEETGLFQWEDFANDSSSCDAANHSKTFRREVE